jgi:VWFA-related protein
MPLLRRQFLQTALSGFMRQEVRFSAGVKVVTVFAAVRDRHGRLVPDLAKEDFRLAEDGQPQEIRYFSRESDLPLKIGILIDTSASQYGILESERRASYAFLDRVLREGQDVAFVAKFDIAVTTLQELTPSRKDLQKALQAADLPTPIRPAAEPAKENILIRRSATSTGYGAGWPSRVEAPRTSDQIERNQVFISSLVSMERAF